MTLPSWLKGVWCALRHNVGDLEISVGPDPYNSARITCRKCGWSRISWRELD